MQKNSIWLIPTFKEDQFRTCICSSPRNVIKRKVRSSNNGGSLSILKLRSSSRRSDAIVPINIGHKATEFRTLKVNHTSVWRLLFSLKDLSGTDTPHVPNTSASCLAMTTIHYPFLAQEVFSLKRVKYHEQPSREHQGTNQRVQFAITSIHWLPRQVFNQLSSKHGWFFVWWILRVEVHH